MSTELTRLSELAKDKGRQFLAIAHLLTPELMQESFRELRKKASAGVDGVTYEDYVQEAEENIRGLHERIRSKRYQVQPLRRVYIPKSDGKQRPISIPCLEDKVVQRAAVKLLDVIYEETFLECSYGFRPKRSPHDALDQIGKLICRHRVSYVLEADIRSYFDSIVREKLMGMVARRVRDGSILRLIGKWINVGVIDQGRLLVTQTGTGQGQPASPLLANIYLHYVLDEWFEREVKPHLRGEASEVRFADDFILLFQYRGDAVRVQEMLHRRMAEFGLTLHPEKTRLIEFGRFAQQDAKRRGAGKAATFDFLGFTHVCATSRKGRFTVHLRIMRKRLVRGLREVADWCRKCRHRSVKAQVKTLNQKLRGHYEYYGRPTNYPGLWRFYRGVRSLLFKWLNRRTRGDPLTWLHFAKLLQGTPLLLPWITHPLASMGSSA